MCSHKSLLCRILNLLFAFCRSSPDIKTDVEEIREAILAQNVEIRTAIASKKFTSELLGSLFSRSEWCCVCVLITLVLLTDDQYVLETCIQEFVGLEGMPDSKFGMFDLPG